MTIVILRRRVTPSELPNETAISVITATRTAHGSLIRRHLLAVG